MISRYYKYNYFLTKAKEIIIIIIIKENNNNKNKIRD
jgi:hypothetical protein